jgi:hypothetical protein
LLIIAATVSRVGASPPAAHTGSKRVVVAFAEEATSEEWLISAARLAMSIAHD